MGPNLKIEISKTEDGQNYQIIKFVGEFDKAGHTEIREQLNTSVKDFSLKFLIFDFAELKFINSEGIGYLMEIHTHLFQRDRQLVIIGANEHVTDVFKAIGIAEIIPIYTDLHAFLSR